MRTRFVAGCLVLVSLVSACQARAPAVQQIEARAGDVILAATVAGDPKNGNVVIAIHGGPGNSSDYMVSLLTLRSDRLAVVTYDQRGTGRSGKPAQGYALDTQAEDVEAIRQAVGAEQVHVLGHSWGGIVALRYATLHPERVRSLILLGSGPPSASDVAAAQASLGRRVAQLQAEGLIPAQLPDSGAAVVQALLPAYFSDPAFSRPDELRNMSFDAGVSDLTYRQTEAWDFRAQVRELDVPALMLWGEDDPFGMPMAEATRSELTSADVTFVVLENCGHYWQECQNEALEQIGRFLDAQDVG